MLEHSKFVLLDSAVALVDAGEVDFGVEFDVGRVVGVVGSALNLHEVNSVVEGGSLGSQDGAVPVGEGLVVGVGKTVRDGLVADSLLSFLELLVEAECAGH